MWRSSKPLFLRFFFFKVRHFFVKVTRRSSGKVALVLSLAALASCVATYLALSKSGTFEDKTHRVLPFIYLDLILLFSLLIVIIRRLVSLWSEHKQGLAGSRLHIKLVLLFSAIAVTPAILVAIFSALFFNFGVKAWFSEPVKAAIEEARSVAQAYLEENQNAIRHDAATIVAEMRPHVPMLINDKASFSEMLTDQVEHRGLGEAIVFDISQHVVSRSYLTFALEFEKILIDDFKRAQQGELVIRVSENGDRVRALVRLDPLTNTYLYLGKFVDAKVLHHLNQTQGAVAEYHRLENQRSGLHSTFIAFFVLIAIILLFASIWVGLSLAYFLVQPVRQLITAAESVRQGDLGVSVKDIPEDHELGHLADAFNRMIAQVYFQRKELISKNEELEHRQQFIESVLSGVSAGIIGMNAHHKIDLINQRALELLRGKNHNDERPKNLSDISQEILSLVGKVTSFSPYSEQITIERDGRSRILQVCIVPETKLTRPNSSKLQGYVVTFDDITSLVSAQRKAAWSDVARRIAHEIKNPLTPIQLSAERLKRRYFKEIQADPETFIGCIDTIIRQVSHIGKLVSEFSSFARMPEPDLKPEDLGEICRQAIFLQQEAHKDVAFDVKIPPTPITFLCDAQQISQVLTNLLQNALDALEDEGNSVQNDLRKENKILYVTLTQKNHEIALVIADNGPGFPLQNRERLLEPYVTTRSKGTGLGLAIVVKIVEDHGGTLELTNSPVGGAVVIIRFAKQSTENKKIERS